MKKITLLAVMLVFSCTSALQAITISGGPNVCIGISKTLTIDTSGGTWSISNPATATIGSTTGIITGLTIGSATVTYTVGTAVFTAPVLIYPQPGAITGTGSTCAGSGSTLTVSGSGSGTWTSSNSSVASIGTGSGVLNGITPGTTTVTYTRTISGCFVTRTQTVLSTPSSIAGVSSMCMGTTQTLTSTPAGGTWTRSNATVASIGAATGILNGLAAGSTNVIYTLPGGCNTTRTFSVINLPAAITGTATTCVGNTTTLTSATSGGTWSSATTSVATIGSTTGMVTGIATGTSLITYAVGTGCSRTTTVNISSAIGSIAGASVVCTGQTATLTNSTSGGTWTSSNTAIATVGLSSGIVSGITAGTATISYRLSGCLATAVITITATPSAITGNANVCMGASTAFTHTITGGSWSSSNPSIASVNSTSGIVMGVNVGTATISYFVSAGCYVTKSIGVNPLPNTIYGDSTTCPGSYLSFTNTTPDGTWSSSNTSVATIGSVSGIANGLAAGTSLISYTKTTTGCFKSKILTIISGSGTISGTSYLCSGSTTTLTSSVGGGSWTSSNTTAATVGASSGILTGASAGTTTISYTIGGGCYSTLIVTVSTMAYAGTLSGSSTVAVGVSITLSPSVTGGTWSSSDASIASVGSTGIVTGIGAGTVNISYEITNDCGSDFATKMITVTAADTSSGSVLWATYFGGGLTDGGRSIVSDNDGNIYMVGFTNSPSNISTPGAHQDTLGGENDIFLVKFNSAGIRQWATYYGGSGNENPLNENPIAIDDSGNIYLTGTTFSSNGISTPGAYQENINGGQDAFIVKFNSAGARLWATYYGGAYSENAGAIGVDNFGNVYVSGQTNSDTGIATPGSHLTNFVEGPMAFLVKFNSLGIRKWATYYQGYTAAGVGLSQYGDVYMTGATWSDTGVATTGAYSTSLSGEADVFLVKFDSLGNRIWGTYYGGESNDLSGFLSISNSGDIYFSGGTTSSTGIATTGAFMTSIVGGTQDGFVAKFNESGNLLWSTYYGGAGYENIYSVTLDESNNIFIAGITTSDTGIATSGSYHSSFGGYYDGFAAGFDSSGNRLWGTYFGSDGYDVATSAIVDGEGHLYVAGYTEQATDFTTPGACDTILEGWDAFLIKFNDPETVSPRPIVKENYSLNEIQSLQFFPNPTSGDLKINSESHGQISVYSIDGRVVASESLTKGTNHINLPAQLARGMYVVRFKGDDGSAHMARIILE